MELKRIAITSVITVIAITLLAFCILFMPGQDILFFGEKTIITKSISAIFPENDTDTNLNFTISTLFPDYFSPLLQTSDTVPLNTIPESLTVLVNRTYRLPSYYVPKVLVNVKVEFSFDYSSDKRKLRKEAARALEKMFAAAKKEKKIKLYGVSGYRSYKRQNQIYRYNVSHRGHDATDSVSALPGSSEHQTGLTIDISSKSVDLELIPAFAKTREGKWVAKNAHKFGFIIRYPKGKSKITGYSFEPWHLRYVGKNTASYLYKNKLTLEEYYGISKNN